MTRQDINENHGPTDLERHVSFWDRDGDGVIHVSDVWNGFRELGFSIPYSLISLFIPLLFSYATQSGHPKCTRRDPRFRICVYNIHRTIHSSHSEVFDDRGRFNQVKFDAMFKQFDVGNKDYLSTCEFLRMWRSNCDPCDFGGWLYSFMELFTTWLLIQKNGQIARAELRGVYDGSLFYSIKESRHFKRIQKR
ncbi:hypothetical protein PV08_06568 [Exophiala spinifera]|uniref:EF-hand domain-containing protein n=1 Tax=Exophiala spinifera TaxID=91928 RepID=A0A0D2BC34_9EURO|nr:uncharacterized protein PV08_06568 [Exophiala spinifera]KIW16513.1 hypothetical protein PV08_06568 [Exophiala spinifera]